MKFLKQFSLFESTESLSFTDSEFGDIKDAFRDVIDEWNLVEIDISKFNFPKDAISYYIKPNVYNRYRFVALGNVVTIQIAIPNSYRFENQEDRNKFEQDCNSFTKRLNHMGFKQEFSKNKSFFYEFWTIGIHKKV